MESVRIEVSKGKIPIKAILRGTDHPEVVEAKIKRVERGAQALDLDLKVVRSSGKSTVGFSGVSQEAWDNIFRGRRGKGKKGK
jgi:hypothetical protein